MPKVWFWDKHMEDKSWIKLYRKIGEHEILFDDTALRLFIWLLTHCDRSTGEIKVSKHWTAEAVRLKGTTFYDALKRLEKKYKVISLTPNKKYTQVRLLNWAKYQSTEQSTTTKPNVQRPKPDTLTRRENKEISPNGEDAAALVTAKKEISVKKRLSEKQELYLRVCKHLETVLATKLTNYPAQMKAIKSMFDAGYTEKQIMWTIDQMEKEEWYEDKGFDLITVMKQIPLYKAKVRKGVSHVQQT